MSQTLSNWRVRLVAGGAIAFGALWAGGGIAAYTIGLPSTIPAPVLLTAAAIFLAWLGCVCGLAIRKQYDGNWHPYVGFRLLGKITMIDGTARSPGQDHFMRRRVDGAWQYRLMTAAELDDEAERRIDEVL